MRRQRRSYTRRAQRYGVPLVDLSIDGDGISEVAVTLIIAWTLLLATWCAISGVVIASLIPASRPGATIAAAVGGSVLPLTAYFGGISIEWG